MDSLTQAALGAAVAHACWHRSLGRWAVPWGLAFGTLPDLDILAYPWLDDVQRLYWHRGESHSWWAMLLGALPLAWLVRRVHRRAAVGLSFGRAYAGAALIWATHVAIDFFTVYGTQLLAPFNRHGFQTGNLFIIDPAYTLPLVIGLVLAVVLRQPSTRRAANLAGLALSTAYVGWSFGAQARAERVFAAELTRQGYVVAPGAAQTSATPFNTLLWRHLAPVEGGFLLGYWSWLDDGAEGVRFEFLPQRAELVAAVDESRAFRAIAWFSQGFWLAQPREEGGRASVRVVDLRFGEVRPAPGAPLKEWGWPFGWDFPAESREGDEPALRAAPADLRASPEVLSRIGRRVAGERTAW